tara:strand:+ start:1315 stop:2244 length:930 start_codon:yes stop_codon:yes gene_type:complete
MILKKPKFWDDKIGLFSILLLPITLITLILIFIKKKIIQPIQFDIPIICVGNIYLGGTGKTPTSILLAKVLSTQGEKTAILRKFYKNHADEHDLIKTNFKDLILDKNRINGIHKIQKIGYDYIILDDGFQDYKIKKNLNIVCFNSNQQIGNGLIIPSGPLRENLGALKNAQIILINGEKDSKFEEKIFGINKKLKIFYSYYKPLNLSNFKGKKLMAIAAIGNPFNFFELLKKNKLEVEEEKIYPDHYKFSKREIENLTKYAKKNNYKIIMTEKDYFKFKYLSTEKFDYLKVSLQIENFENFIKIVRSYV